MPLTRRDVAGFEYSDCHADDARLVVLNAVDAAEHGATIRTYTRCRAAERGADWRLVLDEGGEQDTVTAQRAGERDRAVARTVRGRRAAG